MTFLQIVDAILRNLFDESDRANAKDWCNHRYGWLLALEEWAFLDGSAAVSVTANSQVVGNLPADFGIATGLWNSDGKPLKAYTDEQEFFDRYNTELGDTGQPEAFCVVGAQILVGPVSNETKTDYLLLYQKETAAMSADGDVPVIPSLFHLALVHGGRAEGMKMQHNPAWQAVEQDFLASIDAMRRRYLVKVRQAGDQVPAFRP